MSYGRREAALNWLALGLLLAAWNAVDDASAAGAAPPRPAALRGYAWVSMRALQRVVRLPSVPNPSP
jgi:hypothetical protein